MTIKLRPTFTFDQERVDALRAIAPEAFADGKINWDVLHEALGDHLEDEGRDAEHFGLFWPGKREARRLATVPSAGALRAAPGEGVNEDTTRNIFIEGDNLEVLKLLQKSYADRVTLIYIDPPYNTGNDFIYSDDFAQPLDEYLRATGQADDMGRLLVSNSRAGGRYHSNWLSMMYPRLRLARTLLRNDGAIFVSIDDHEVHNLRALMNEVFGEENFIATIIWHKMDGPKNSAMYFSEDHDYILVYARNAEVWRPNSLPRSEEMLSRYTNPDIDPRGPWLLSDLAARNYYGAGRYPITTPSGKVIIGPPAGSYWRVSKARFDELDRDNRIWWGKTGDNRPGIKRFLSEVREGVVPQTYWAWKDVGSTRNAKQELSRLMVAGAGEDLFVTPKPTRLVQRMLQIATDKDSVVLDFFAGTATTGHAVLDTNREDGGSRRFIMIQFPEPTGQADYATIAEIGKERIRKVIQRKQSEDAVKLPSGRDEPEDLGFKVFKLGRSNYKGWRDFEASDVAELQTLFDRFESPLVDGWKAEDVLVEIMLIEGFPLDSVVSDLPQFSSNHVQEVASDMLAHRLFVCLDAHVDDETIAALTMGEDDVFICLDSALCDEAKVRLEDGRRVKVI